MCWRWFNAQVSIGAVAFTISFESREKLNESVVPPCKVVSIDIFVMIRNPIYTFWLSFLLLSWTFFSCGVNKNEVYRLKFCRLQRNDFINFHFQISFLKSHSGVLRVGDTAKPEVLFFFCFTTGLIQICLQKFKGNSKSLEFVDSSTALMFQLSEFLFGGQIPTLQWGQKMTLSTLAVNSLGVYEFE